MVASMAASAALVISGGCQRCTRADTVALTSAPPISVPRMVETTVADSSQALATTNRSAGSNSVRMPYLAGEYAAAPMPTTAYAASGWNDSSISTQPTILMALVISMTR